MSDGKIYFGQYSPLNTNLTIKVPQSKFSQINYNDQITVKIHYGLLGTKWFEIDWNNFE
jgi:hypothetical protein